MTHSHVAALPPAPERVGLPSLVTGLAGVGVLIGGAALGWAFSTGELALAWSTYLIGAFFALGLGVFALAWLAIVNLAGGTWSVTMRRVPEAMTAWLLPGGVLALLVILGSQTLYQWAHPDVVKADEILTHRAPFLNTQMFLIFGVVSVVLWFAFAARIVGASLRQDREGGMSATRSNRAMSALFLVVFALTFSAVSFYFLLSLDAHWFSTMFAVLVFTDIAQTGTAFIVLVTVSFFAPDALVWYSEEGVLPLANSKSALIGPRFSVLAWLPQTPLTIGLFFAVLLLAAAVCAQPKASAPDEARIAQLKARMKSFVEQGRTAGIVSLLAYHGQIIHADAVGYQSLETKTPMRLDTLFQIASMTNWV